jgi:hypothetical protein
MPIDWLPGARSPWSVWHRGRALAVVLIIPGLNLRGLEFQTD